jgi:FixJ family two-component response regulator
MTGGPLVVVVEDDPASRKTLVRVLLAGGFEAAMHASAEDFLASPPAPGAIGLLLDLHLGGMSGIELQRRLRDSGSTLPIVIVTAFDDAHSRRQAEQLGCVAFLNKPCEAETILRVLRSLTQTRQEPLLE